MARLGSRRRRALAAGLLQALAWAVAAPLVAVANEELVGVPVHLEQPNDADCPAAHNHLFCQAVRSLTQPLAAPLACLPEQPAPAPQFLGVRAHADVPAGLAFLVGSVVPRGPPTL